MRTVAALFVRPDGCYVGLPDVDPWDEARDATRYAGPYPVVAHPPCSRWCMLAGFVEHRYGYRRGEDGGLFASALASVRRWGGVLEHPAYPRAWRAYGLPAPQTGGGWMRGLDGSLTCYVEQVAYGHLARKATWLYAVGIDPLELRWGCSVRNVLGSPAPRPHPSGGPNVRWRAAPVAIISRLTHGVSSAKRLTGGKGDTFTISTPPEFRNELLRLARTVEAR